MEWLGRQLQDAMDERDRYREWFEKLNEATARYIATVQPIIDRKQGAAARAAKSLQSDRHALRARQLGEAGLSRAVIGQRIALEDGRPDRPYDARQVRRWLEREPKPRTL